MLQGSATPVLAAMARTNLRCTPSSPWQQTTARPQLLRPGHIDTPRAGHTLAARHRSSLRAALPDVVAMPRPGDDGTLPVRATILRWRCNTILAAVAACPAMRYDHATRIHPSLDQESRRQRVAIRMRVCYGECSTPAAPSIALPTGRVPFAGHHATDSAHPHLVQRQQICKPLLVTAESPCCNSMLDEL